MVKFGHVKFVVSSKSEYNPLEFWFSIRNTQFDNKSGFFSVASGEEEIDRTPVGFATGNAEVVYTVKDPNGSFKDSLIQEIVVPHNETLAVYINYP